MTDALQRFDFEHHPIRGEWVHLEASWQAVIDGRDYPQPVRGLLGQLLVAASLLSATLKFSGSITLQIQGDGPVSLLVADCTARRTVRGVAHWEGEVPAEGLAAQFGTAKLVITIDPGEGLRRYQGIVELTGETLAEAIDAYLEQSEQLPTRMWLTVTGQHAAGLLLQRMPGSDSDADAWNRVTTLGETITGAELVELDGTRVVRRLFHEEDVRLFDSEPVSFRCGCSRERVESVLRGLGRDEVFDILAREGEVAVNCEFCGRRYGFDAVDAEQLFVADGAQPAVPSTRQ